MLDADIKKNTHPEKQHASDSLTSEGTASRLSQAEAQAQGSALTSSPTFMTERREK